ncbi:hypothetical protein RirG_225490 [Rhizophagus irregularis DAOM 197198w]|uniref:Uncharacterized protein n=1 Tax=Rhizophagus irregularis (strain DAOM 197198w) TaxID=1432141 RepID=A0A015K7I6_RHIIW|nr:hypothetical protein RirG_225490 [Rhizophagus irregularis DAOM 197198w]
MASKRSKNAKNSKKRKQAFDIPEGQRRKQALDVPEGQNESQQNIFAQMLSVESSEIPKDQRTDREKSPTGPFVLVTPFDVDRERSLVKSVYFTPANREKSSTNRENSLVRTAHTETSISTTLTPSVTPMSYERTSRMPTPILSPMQIDLDKEIDYYNVDDDDNEEQNDNRDKSDTCEPLPKPHNVEGERYLTVKEFNYAMNTLDGKRVYKNVAKEFIPTSLYLSDIEYRKALETYLSKHAEHYIKNIGQNAWISLFSDKLLAEIKTKCRSRRNDFAASIRSAMFSVFGEQRLERIDNNSSSMKIAEWKQNQKTRNAFYELFKNHDILTKIGHLVFKQYRDKELHFTHCAYILSICDILLNPNNYSIKCNNKSVTKRVEFFLQAFRNKMQITLQIMEELAEKEVKEVSQKTDQYESAVAEESSDSVENENYDDFVS